jgi:hypothetical protein
MRLPKGTDLHLRLKTAGSWLEARAAVSLNARDVAFVSNR